MKQIEATIVSSRLNAAVGALNDIVGGFTVTEGRGRGSSKRRTVRQGRGTGSAVAEYTAVVTITSIVSDSDVEKVTSALSAAVYTGNAGDGIIAVRDVESVVNISNKKSGNEAL